MSQAVVLSCRLHDHSLFDPFSRLCCFLNFGISTFMKAQWQKLNQLLKATFYPCLVLRSALWIKPAGLCGRGCDLVCRNPLLSTELKPWWVRCRQPFHKAAEVGTSTRRISGQASSWTASRRSLYTRVTAPRRTHLPLKRAILSAQSDILLKLELTPLLYICLDELSREDTGPPGSHWAWFWTDLLFVSTLPNIASGHKIQGELWAVYASLRCFDRTHLWGW